MVVAAAIGAGASLIGGLLDNKKNEKAANTAFRYQIDLNSQALFNQQILTGEQNRQTNALNDRVEAFNRDILDNHSTNWSKSDTTQSDITTSAGSIDFKRLVADAEAAGFNPLTVLRSGGLAGYMSSNVATMSRLTQETESKQARDLMTYFAMPDAAQAQHPGAAPIAQTTNAFSNAINTGLGIWQQGNADRLANAKLDVERGLAQAQIANLSSDTKLNQARTTVALRPPTATASSVFRQGGGFAGAIRNNSGLIGAVMTPEAGKVTVTNAHGVAGAVDPNQNDNEMYETRYGDIVGDLIGVGIAARDGWHYLNSKTGNAPNSAVKTAVDYLGKAFKAETAANAKHAPQGYNIWQ